MIKLNAHTHTHTQRLIVCYVKFTSVKKKSQEELTFVSQHLKIGCSKNFKTNTRGRRKVMHN